MWYLSARLMMLMTVAAIAATAILSLPVNAESDSNQSREYVIEIKDLKFIPSQLKVRPGDTITLINRDFVPHTATAEDGSWDTGTIKKDEARSQMVTLGMQLSYYCHFHPNMTGKLELSANR